MAAPRLLDRDRGSGSLHASFTRLARRAFRPVVLRLVHLRPFIPLRPLCLVSSSAKQWQHVWPKRFLTFAAKQTSVRAFSWFSLAAKIFIING